MLCIFNCGLHWPQPWLGSRPWPWLLRVTNPGTPPRHMSHVTEPRSQPRHVLCYGAKEARMSPQGICDTRSRSQESIFICGGELRVEN